MYIMPCTLPFQLANSLGYVDDTSRFMYLLIFDPVEKPHA